MRSRTRSSMIRLTGMVLVVFVLHLFLAAFPPPAAADECEQALVKCLVDAGLSSLLGLFGGGWGGAAAVGLTYANFCYNGYLFCKEYYSN